jgi:hypothetical protein
MQEFAHDAVMGKLGGTSIYKLASIGSWGTRPSHCERDFKRFFTKDMALPELDDIRIPYFDIKDFVVATRTTCSF